MENFDSGAFLSSEPRVAFKSKLGMDIRRFSVNPNLRDVDHDGGAGKGWTFNAFCVLIDELYQLKGEFKFLVFYRDSQNDLLPVTNDYNLACMLRTPQNPIRLVIVRNDCRQSLISLDNGHRSDHKAHLLRLSNLLGIENQVKRHRKRASSPSRSALYRSLDKGKHQSSMATGQHIDLCTDFRLVSSIIDTDILPSEYRRVRLRRQGSENKPLGFYVRDGLMYRPRHPNGPIDQVSGIFISKLLPGGLAECTGLLSVNDEIVQVNGIPVTGKSLDQVTDMMVASSTNLVLTVKPFDQTYNIPECERLNGRRSLSLTPSGTLSSSLRRSSEDDLICRDSNG